MDSKKTFSLRWRLFLPMVVLLWGIITVLVVYMVEHEKAVKRSNLELQLKNINTTILQAYEQGEDLQSMVDFVNIYNDNTTLDDLRVSVYTDQGTLVANSGAPLLMEDGQHNIAPEIRKVVEDTSVDEVTSVRNSYTDRKKMMFNVMTSNDGFIQVMSATPYNVNVSRALSYDPTVWIIVTALGLTVTVLAFYVTVVISRNVNTLRHFAKAAAAGDIDDLENINFGNDEFSEVSRQITSIYRDKDRALERFQHEHEVAMRAVSERERIKREMSNNINHELKTPVGIIKGYLDTINSDPDMPESLRRSFLEKAQQHADRLTQLLKDVSSITRLDDGSQQVEITEFDFHDLVYNLANDLEVSRVNGSLHFDYSVPFDCFVRGNYTLLNNALMNLVRNAANYSKGTKITLKMLKETTGNYTFSFADDGVGVPSEHIPRLFDRFYRVDEGRARKSGGTGLGLPIVKSTINAIGGNITVQNASPHGLEFIFTIPKAGKNQPRSRNERRNQTAA